MVLILCIIDWYCLVKLWMEFSIYSIDRAYCYEFIAITQELSKGIERIVYDLSYQ